MLAHNIRYTYIAHFVAPAGLGARVDLVLFIFGASALVGIWITGKLVDRHLRSTVLASLAAFGATALAFGLVPANPAVIYVGIAVWGISFGGAATLLQTALADAAGRGADVALSMNVVAWNGAIAGAGVVGGMLLDVWGAGVFPWALVILAGVAFMIASSGHAYAFRPGLRSSGAVVVGH
ncbi:hypothetical protein G6F65_020466 [Rhizopus arrhizus]|nr:hypothetical protein G6F65_020466 [Rhizopus arrhizus]